MHNVFVSVVCTKRGGGAKALYPSKYNLKYTNMHLRMCVER